MMKVTYLGGPRDGDEAHIDPLSIGVEQEMVAVPTKDGGFVTKHYKLHRTTKQYVWEDLTLGKS